MPKLMIFIVTSSLELGLTSESLPTVCIKTNFLATPTFTTPKSLGNETLVNFLKQYKSNR